MLLIKQKHSEIYAHFFFIFKLILHFCTFKLKKLLKYEPNKHIYMKKILSTLLVLGIFGAFAQETTDPEIFYNQAKLSYKMRKLEHSLAQCDKALALDSMHYEALLLKGMCHYDNKNYDEALKWATKSIEIYNRNDEAYFERGMMYFYLDKFEDAALDFQMASKIGIKRADYVYFNGLSLKEIGKNEDACKAFKKAKKMKFEENVDKMIEETCGN